jgi:adenylate kinase
VNLLFLGPPGCGKGTQAVRLAGKLGMVHLSTGDLLREAVAKGTALGKEAEGYMKRGELVPDGVMVGLIEQQVASGALNSGFILDGFPRTTAQATTLKEMLSGKGLSLDRAVLFRVSDEEIVRRLSGRWSCPQCHAAYNYPSAVPRKEGRCDRDGTELRRRPDDEEVTVRKRLEVYRRQTRPVVDFYRAESILVEVGAEDSQENVYQALFEAINEGAGKA